MCGTAHAFVSVGCVHVCVCMFMHMETSRQLRGSLHFFFLIHGLLRTLKLIDSARLADASYTGIIGTCCHAQLVKQQQNQKPNVGFGNLTSGFSLMLA